VGLERQRDGVVTLNPDEEVQARLRLIFAKFTELGSARAVRTSLAREQLRIPSRPVRGPAPHDTVWNPPRRSMIRRMLHNPAYAGAYAYGQRVVDPARQQPGRRRSGVVQMPLAQWAVCLQDVYPASMTWDTYLANRARLQANRNGSGQGGPGVPREGKALLQGIAICGRCGRRMQLRYSGPQGDFPVYRCGLEAQDYGGAQCQEVRAPGVDQAVEALVLEALVPERIALALEALGQLEREMDALEHQWHLRLERARYEAQRAQRQYNAAEPEHRLVARTLESQWEAALRAVASTERDYETWTRENRAHITAQEQQEILAIGEDLPRVWHAETTTNADRKHLLRFVVQEVIVDQKRIRGKVWLQINWQTGASSEHAIIRHAVSYREHSEGERVQERLGQLHAQQQTDRQIAEVLNTEGYCTTYGQRFRPQNIWYLRGKWGLPNIKERGLRPDRLRWDDGAYTIAGVVQAVGVNKGTVHTWLELGRMKGWQLGPYMGWHIDLTADQMSALRQQAEHVRLTRKCQVTRGPQPQAAPEQTATR
jgi:hypothetical protein